MKRRLGALQLALARTFLLLGMQEPLKFVPFSRVELALKNCTSPQINLPIPGLRTARAKQPRLGPERGDPGLLARPHPRVHGETH